jgi:hypothetical protein
MEMKNGNKKKKGNDVKEKKKLRKMVGNTIMDVALDAMRQLGFEKKTC